MTNEMKKYAIIKSGGKQYRVVEGESVDVELLDAQAGENVEFKDVLSIHHGDKTKIGSQAKGSTVQGEVIETVYGPKVTSIKYRPSHHEYRKFGHRQRYTRVKITAIGAKEKSKEKETK